VGSCYPTLNAYAFRMGHPGFVMGEDREGRPRIPRSPRRLGMTWGWGSCDPTLGARAKARRGWGTPVLWWVKAAKGNRGSFGRRGDSG